MGKSLKQDYVAKGLDYARAVLKGEVPACKWVRLACKRQLDDLKRWKTKKSLYHFDTEKANNFCSFMENLPHIKGIWAKRKETIKLEPWQCFIFTTLFGWINQQGLRRFRVSYIEIPKKNAKSTCAAGVGLYMLTEDGEEGAEIYAAAASEDQANIVFDMAKKMAEKDADFRQHYGLKVFEHNLNVISTASKFEALSAKGATNQGINPHCGIEDELHAHKSREIHDVIDSAFGSRQQPLHFKITTAGVSRASICWEQRMYLIKLLQRTIHDETFFGIIYGIDDEDLNNWDSEDVWKKANPNYGISVDADDMRRLCKTAQNEPSARHNFLTMRLNVWVNADSAWMNMLEWDKCADPSLKLEDFNSEPCWEGLDLASKIDIAAKVYIFKDKEEDDAYVAFIKCYLPEENVHDEAHSKTAHYEGWSKAGWLTLTPGNMIALKQIEEEVREDMEKFDVRAVGYDPWQAAQMAGTLYEEGVPMVEVRPSVQNFSDPMKQLEALVKAGKFRHDGNPVLTWMISNVVCHRDEKENIFPKKEKKDSPNKIDGAVALITALNRVLADDGSSGRSVYDHRGLIWV